MAHSLVNFSDFKLSEQYGLLEIVELAAEICRVPVATITFLDVQNPIITFKISQDFTSQNSNLAFSRKIIEEERAIVINDLKNSLVFNDFETVEKNNTRFYLGVPIILNNGAIIGSLCVFDLTPKQLPYKQLDLLNILAKQITTIVEFGHDADFSKWIYNAKHLKEKVFPYLDNSDSCHYLFNAHMKLDAFNKTAERLVKKMLRVKLVAGTIVTDHLNDVDFFRNSFLEAFSGKLVKTEFKSYYPNNAIIWWEIICGPIFDAEGIITGVFYNTTDITQKKENEQSIISTTDALDSMAFILAHELRKPVVSILGLMNIINLNDYGAEDRQFLKMLLQLTLDLDEKIKMMVNKINYLVA